MRFKAFLPLFGVLLIATVSPSAAPRPSTSLLGFWRNPRGTVEVRINACGGALCGTVVNASPVAIADARDSGHPHLIGMALMHDYRATGSRKGRGAIFVPDIGRSVASHIELVDADTVRVSGCLIGRFFCKSQLWRRA